MSEIEIKTTINHPTSVAKGLIKGMGLFSWCKARENTKNLNL